MSRVTEVKEMIVNVMRKNMVQLEGHSVFIFGSRATGEARERSDFDIGVVGDSPLDLKIFFEIDDQLKALPTLYKIDWVDFNRVSDRFRERAMQKTELIYG